MDLNTREERVTLITPPKGWGNLELREIFEYRDLFFFLVWRDIKVLYAQTVLGFGWAIANPVIQIVLFTVVFGAIAKVQTDDIPYFLFAAVAIIPWTYMSNSLTGSSLSLVTGQSMLGKVYFPRIIYPIVPVLAKLVDFAISLIVIVLVMLFYNVEPTMNLLYLPIFIIEMIIIPAGLGLWLSALAIRYRDVKFIVQFVIRMLMYTAPIVYSASSIPEVYRFIYSLNPLVSVIEGIRASVLGTEIEWIYIIPGYIIAILIFVSGVFYFKKMERVFSDVI